MHVSQRYIGRLAPSPTGLLHLGHAATFLAAYDRARAANGQILLRIDDLDPQRSKQVYIDTAKEDLQWLGVTWNAEVFQSNRLDSYRRALDRLVSEGYAYPCICTRKDLQQAIRAPHEDADEEPVYNGRCRPTAMLAATQFQSPKLSSRPERSEVERSAVPELPGLQQQSNYRFHVPDGEIITFHDINCGPQRFVAGEDFGDFLVWRKDGLPSYQLACVVDEADMGITEVVRGRDLLKSTARQILMQRALGLPTPGYFHTHLLYDERGQRLAKRHDALSLRTLREGGVTPAEIRARIDGLLHHTDL